MHVANGMKAFVKFLAQSQSIYIGLRSKNIKFVDENAFVWGFAVLCQLYKFAHLKL